MMFNPYMQEAKGYRKAINAFAKNQTDETLLDNKVVFSLWRAGIQVVREQILRYNDELYRVNQDHTTQNDWTPDITPALYTKISLEEYPEWIQPTGAQDAYNTGDKCSHNGKHWTSNLDGNVWEPGIYGWSEV